MILDNKWILYEKRGHVAYVTINRPEVMNAIHPPAHAELDRVWDDVRDDPALWLAIFTGSGERAFCAGADLKHAAQNPTEARPRRRSSHGFGGLTNRYDLFKPVIAAVNGVAVGGGMEMMMACDIAVAAEHATFGQPEPRVGRAATSVGGVVRLVRHLPWKQAMGLILTGQRISALDAYRVGLINEVVPAAKLMEAAEHWANQILECSPIAIQASKEAAIKSLDMPLSLALDTTFEYTVRSWSSKDPAEGAKAFVEKRKPRWENPI